MTRELGDLEWFPYLDALDLDLLFLEKYASLRKGGVFGWMYVLYLRCIFDQEHILCRYFFFFLKYS